MQFAGYPDPKLNLFIMVLFDTHSHIYVPEFDNDRGDMMERADKAGIAKVLMPAIDSSTHGAMLQLTQHFPGVCLPMMGVHPCSVKTDYENELKVAENHLASGEYVAVGETGLDFYWDTTYTEQQYTAFQKQIDWALQYDIPVVIHSRNSIDECIEMIEKNQDGKLRGVFHCFTGTAEQAQKIIGLGFFLGIGGVVTFKNSGLDKIVATLPMESMVLETDAPYLAPVPHRGKRNEPSYLSLVAQKMADVTGLTLEEVARITTANATKLFRL